MHTGKLAGADKVIHFCVFEDAHCTRLVTKLGCIDDDELVRVLNKFCEGKAECAAIDEIDLVVVIGPRLLQLSDGVDSCAIISEQCVT